MKRIRLISESVIVDSNSTYRAVETYLEMYKIDIDSFVEDEENLVFDISSELSDEEASELATSMEIEFEGLYQVSIE